MKKENIDYILKKAIFYTLIFSIILLLINIINALHLIGVITSFFGYLMPLFTAFIFVWLLNPLILFLESKKLKRIYAILLVYFLILILIFAFLNYLTPLLIRQVKSLTEYLPQVKDFIYSIYLQIMKIYESLGFDASTLIKKDDILSFAINFFKNYVFTSLTSVSNSIIIFLKSTFSFFSSLLVTLVLSFYLFVDYKNITKQIEKCYPKKIRNEMIELLKSINKFLNGFIKGTGTISLFIFIFVSTGLSLIGMPSAIFFGFFCGITNIIPFLGPLIGGTPILIVAFSIDFKFGLLAAIVVFGAQFIESNFLQPVVMGKLTNLHPVIIMVSIIIFGNIFGIWGIIFATPLAGISKEIIIFLNKRFQIF